MYSVEDVLATYPCYMPERVQELFGDKTHLTLDDLRTMTIPEDDKIWIACKLSKVCQAKIEAMFCDYLRSIRITDRDTQAWIDLWLEGHRDWHSGYQAHFKISHRLLCKEYYSALHNLYAVTNSIDLSWAEYVTKFLGECDE